MKRLPQHELRDLRRRLELLSRDRGTRGAMPESEPSSSEDPMLIHDIAAIMTSASPAYRSVEKSITSAARVCNHPRAHRQPVRLWRALIARLRAHEANLVKNHMASESVRLPSGGRVQLARWTSDWARLTLRVVRSYRLMAEQWLTDALTRTEADVQRGGVR